MTVGAASQKSDFLRNHDFFKIHIKHIPTNHEVTFEGFVTQFSDTYTAQWNEEQVYGRMDPLATYQGTKRNITLGFDIPADSKEMATFNMQMIQKLIQFMYPVYESGDLSTQNVLQAAPLLTLKWTNLISSVNNEGQELVGYINGPISYAPDVAEGGFIHNEVVERGFDKEMRRTTVSDLRNYFPKKISMNFNFTVLHTHLLGWAPNSNAPSGDEKELPPAVLAALAEGGQSPRPKKKVASYVFGGGSYEVAERFPNIYTAPPKPDRPPQGEKQLQDDYDAAEEQWVRAGEEANAAAITTRSEEELRQAEDRAANRSIITDVAGGNLGLGRDIG
jgi:hypothetical protein